MCQQHKKWRVKSQPNEFGWESCRRHLMWPRNPQKEETIRFSVCVCVCVYYLQVIDIAPPTQLGTRAPMNRRPA